MFAHHSSRVWFTLVEEEAGPRIKVLGVLLSASGSPARDEDEEGPEPLPSLAGPAPAVGQCSGGAEGWSGPSVPSPLASPSLIPWLLRGKVLPFRGCGVEWGQDEDATLSLAL